LGRGAIPDSTHHEETDMKRVAGIAGAMLFSLLVLAPVAVAADPVTDSDRVLVSVNGDVALPAGDEAAVVVVVRGDATIAGMVRTLVVVDGTAELDAAAVQDVVAVRSDITLGTGTVVSGDVRTLDATVQLIGNAEVVGEVKDLGFELIGIGAVLAPAFLLFSIGWALAAIVAALALAALGARQVRAAEEIIRHQPWLTLLVGFAGAIVIPILAVLAIVTIVGAPLGLGVLLGLLPLVAFVGYLVAAIWVGEWILRQTSPGVTRERPYLASVVGVIVLQVLSIVPLATAIASLFGFGAVILLAWRVFRGGGVGTETLPRQAPAPMGA
jgi:hypothetical protein